MALPEMLSALRQLILDDIPEISPFAERVADYTHRFPNLSSVEIEDLAKMPRDRLAVYTTSIFSAQAKMVERNLALSFALLSRGYKSVYGEVLSAFDLVRKVHSHFPWKSTDAWVVATNLVKYLENNEPKILFEEPQLLDCARFECFSWEMRKALDDSPLAGAVELSDLPNQSVEELLGLRVYFSRSSRLLRTSWDIVAARRQFLRAGQENIPNFEARSTFQIGGRSKTFSISWVSISEELFSVLNDVDNRDDLYVSKLAEVFLADVSESTSEQEAFIKFVQMIASFMDVGAMRLARM